LHIENARFEFHEEEIYQMIVTKEKEKLIKYLDQIFISILKGSNPGIESLYTTLSKNYPAIKQDRTRIWNQAT
jgi:hypothetical protein